MSRASAIVMAIILSALQAGCAARQGLELPELQDWETRQAVLGDLERWEFRGRIGVSAGTEGFNGKIVLKQNRDEFLATMSGPLGVGNVTITGEGPRISITDSDGEVTSHVDAETELRQKYGWTIPVQSLRFWALGIPDPSEPAATRFDQSGMLEGLDQRGWAVTIDEYRDGGGQQMPRRITAVNDDAKVRLIIDRWTFH